jgi:integrase
MFWSGWATPSVSGGSACFDAGGAPSPRVNCGNALASIRKRPRKDGTVCYAVLYHVGDRQSSLPFDDPKAAEAFRQAVEVHGAQRALQMHGINPAPRRHARSHDMTVAEWVRHHIDHLTGIEQTTIDSYDRYLRLDIGPFLGDIPLSELTKEDLARWVKHLETTKRAKTGRVLSPKSIKNVYDFLSGVLGAAVPGRIAANPAAGRRLSRKTGDEDGDEMRMLSRDEFDLLLANTSEYWRPLVEFLVAAGCRWGEASALKPADVNRREGTVKILRAWKYSTNGYTIGEPKTKRSKRKINVSSALLDKLDYSHEWLFVNREGGPVRYQGFRRRVWDRAVVKAELDPPPTPHDLRHTCASWMLAAGVPITTVSRHLGHENIQITADTYTDVDRAAFAAAADVMGKLLG